MPWSGLIAGLAGAGLPGGFPGAAGDVVERGNRAEFRLGFLDDAIGFVPGFWQLPGSGLANQESGPDRDEVEHVPRKGLLELGIGRGHRAGGSAGRGPARSRVPW